MRTMDADADDDDNEVIMMMIMKETRVGKGKLNWCYKLLRLHLLEH